MTADGPTPFVANGKPPWSLSMSARDGTPAFLGAVFAKANGADLRELRPCSLQRRVR